jgi:hypothetical protein
VVRLSGEVSDELLPAADLVSHSPPALAAAERSRTDHGAANLSGCTDRSLEQRLVTGAVAGYPTDGYLARVVSAYVETAATIEMITLGVANVEQLRIRYRLSLIQQVDLSLDGLKGDEAILPGSGIIAFTRLAVSELLTCAA